MAAVRGGDLNERRVSGDGPLVAAAQAELDRRRIRARGADRADRVGDRRATETEGIAGIRDLLAEVRARWIVVEQNRRIRLPALVPGRRTLQRQLAGDPAHQRRLDSLDDEILAVGVIENVSRHTRR